MTLGSINQKFEDCFFGKEAGLLRKAFGLFFSFVIISVIGFLALAALEVISSAIAFFLGVSNTPYDIPDCRLDGGSYHGDSC